MLKLMTIMTSIHAHDECPGLWVVKASERPSLRLVWSRRTPLHQSQTLLTIGIGGCTCHLVSSRVRWNLESACVSEQLVPLGQELAIRLEFFAPRNNQLRALKTLQAMQQHWSVFLTQDVFTNLDPEVRPYSEHLAIEGGMVQRTQR